MPSKPYDPVCHTKHCYDPEMCCCLKLCCCFLRKWVTLLMYLFHEAFAVTLQPHVDPRQSLLYVSILLRLHNVYSCFGFAAPEAPCDRSHCDRSLLLRRTLKCTRWCPPPKGMIWLSRSMKGRVTARRGTSLNEQWFWDDCWAAFLSRVCLCSSSAALTAACSNPFLNIKPFPAQCTSL